MAYWIVKAVLSPILRIVFRIRIQGTDCMPPSGPAILASNHQSFIDSLFLPMSVRRRVTFVAKAEYFESWKTAWFFRAVGMIPLRRDGGSASERALAAAADVLDAGGVLGIYPEGTRSPDGRLYKGHTGVARLSLQCRAPVVPVAQLGTAAVQPIGAKFPKLFRRVEIKMGAPLRFGDGGSEREADDPSALRLFTDEVMAAIAELSGQDSAGLYANRDRGRLSAPGSEADPMPSERPRRASSRPARR